MLVAQTADPVSRHRHIPAITQAQQQIAVNSDLLLRLSYRWDVPVATDWISRLSHQHALQIDLLGGHVEVINGQLAGRLQVGVRFQGQRLSADRTIALLAQLGIAAEILAHAPELQEAV